MFQIKSKLMLKFTCAWRGCHFSPLTNPYGGLTPFNQALRGFCGPTVATPRVEVPPFKGRQTSSPSSGVHQILPRPHFFNSSLPFPSLCTFLDTFLSTQFRHYFFAYLFHSIYRFLQYVGSHFGIVLASFLHDFPCLILALILHRSLIVFYPFLHGPNHVFYRKKQQFSTFTFFQET